MVKEKKNFILEYDEANNYIEDIVDYLETKTETIMDFFGLTELKDKIKIIIYNDLESYKKHIEEFFEYHDYMCADTNDGNINLLSIEEAHKTKEHKDMEVDDLKNIITHEFVHVCQKKAEIEHLDKGMTWFWEALATNLGNPTDFRKVEITATNEEIGEDFNSLDKNYPIAYTIGNYLFNNYSREDILEYVKYPSKLLKVQDQILDNAREWSKEKKLI